MLRNPRSKPDPYRSRRARGRREAARTPLPRGVERELLDSKRTNRDAMREYFTKCIRNMEEDEKDGIFTKKMPQGQIVKFHDLLEKLWGWDKLIPLTRSVSWTQYINYLEVYHHHNACKFFPGTAHVASSSVAVLAETCLQKGKHLAPLWKTLRPKMDTILLNKSIILNCLICERAQSVISTASCRFSDVCSAALLCISKEADMICELLVHEAGPSDDYIIDQSSKICLSALSLMNCTLSHPVAASAAMLGIAKEAEVMCEWMRENNRPIDYFFYDDVPLPDVIVDGRKVRLRTLDVMIRILEESSVATGHKIGREEPAITNGLGSNGNSIATDEAANSTRDLIPDVLNYHDQKIKEAENFKKGNIKGEDLLGKLLRLERLLPLYAFSGSSDYSNYLEKYYDHNALGFVSQAAASQNPEALLLDPASGAVHIATSAGGDSSASVSIYCLKMEEALVSNWKPLEQSSVDVILSNTVIHSSLIKECVLSISGTESKFSFHSAIAFVCIAKEADLMIELLKHGATRTDDVIEQSSVIRMCALGLANLKGRQSIAAAAAMMGVAKEATIMCDWIKRENKLLSFSQSEPHELEIEEARLIRLRALDFMTSILQESFLPSP